MSIFNFLAELFSHHKTRQTLGWIAAFVGFVSGTLGIYAFWFVEPVNVTLPSVKISTILPNPFEPDLVVLQNTGDRPLSLSGFQICEHEFREDEKNCCSIEVGTSLGAQSMIDVAFFNPSKADHLAHAQAVRERGDLTCTGFSISVGEIVELLDPSGRELDSRVAE